MKDNALRIGSYISRIIVCVGLIINSSFLILHPATAQHLPLSPQAQASLITCGAGNDFYLAFGHTALRIHDPAYPTGDTTADLDMVYNYGTFDFGAPHFYWNFARGMMNYCLSRTSFENFLMVYDYECRAVWEQPLNLSRQEVNNLFVMLEWNYLPENRYYRYDFFRDNCATRVRDMVQSAAGHSSLTTNHLTLNTSHSPLTTYRRYVHQATGPCLQWWTLGIDLLLGLPTDHRCTPEEAAFYPIVMMQEYASASNGSTSLTGPTVQLLTDHREPLHRSFPPLVAFSLLFVAVALLSWKRLWPRWADRVLFVVAGLVGLFLCFMWFGTDHWCTKWNLNILWASPLLLLIAIRLERSPRWSLRLQLGCFAVALVWVAVCGLSAALVPIILMLALRMACLIPRKPRQPQQPR